MKRQIELAGQSVDYTVRAYPRAKKVRLTVTSDVRCIVTTPRRFPHYRVERFLRDNAAWVIATIERIRAMHPEQTHAERRKEYIQLREKARTLVRQRIMHFSEIYQVDYTGISIRDQRTRWGSCSRKKHLSFNYKIILLPPHLADYVVVHELCHLKEFNHSPAFWNLVAQTIPDYCVYKKDLQKYSR